MSARRAAAAAVVVVVATGLALLGSSQLLTGPGASALSPRGSEAASASPRLSKGPSLTPIRTGTSFVDPLGAECSAISVRPLPSVAIEDGAAPAKARGHWTAASGAAIKNQILATPKGFLADVLVDPPLEAGAAPSGEPRSTLCFSADLVSWHAPTDPALFVNAGGIPFHFFRATTVKSGYAAITAESCAWGYPWPCPEGGWYSLDGVRWQTGIPDAVKYLPSCPQSFGGDNSCPYYLWTPRLELLLGPSGSGLTSVSIDGGNHWVNSNLPARFEVKQLLRTSDGLFVAVGLQFPRPGITAGDVPLGLFTSRNGVSWSRATVPPGSYSPRIVALGSTLVAATKDEDYIGYVWASFDAGRSWVQMADSSGGKIIAEDIQVAGDRIVVFSLGHTLAWSGTPD